MSTPRKVKPLDGFTNVSDPDVVARGTAVCTHMDGNPNYPDSPVDLPVLKADIERFSALIAEALDGSKKVMAEKKKQRETVIKKLRLLGRYVEIACKNDVATLITSGFEPASTVKAVPPPLSEKIRKLAHGNNTGQVLAWIKSVPKASSYELRYAAVGDGETADSWTTKAVTITKTPVVLNGLTPGTSYVFQARALIGDGYTDWSDSLTFICT